MPSGPSAPATKPQGIMVKGVRIKDLVVGTGTTAGPKSLVTVACSLSLRQGKCVWSGELTFSLQGRRVIAGLRYGIRGMAVGGKRLLRISPHLAYGGQGIAGLIPAGAVLIAEVELLDSTDGMPHD